MSKHFGSNGAEKLNKGCCANVSIEQEIKDTGKQAVFNRVAWMPSNN
jgi:hypothetical protein